MRHKLIPTILAVAAVGLLAGPAQAHPKVTSSSPAAGAHSPSPAEIRISFTEVLFPKFSAIVLKDSKGRTVSTGPAVINPKDKKQMAAPVRARLAPGTYRVEWRAVSADTHRVQGDYTFMVH